VSAHPEQAGIVPKRARSNNPLDPLWNILASPISGIVLLVLTAFMVTLSGILPQLPATLSDPLAQTRWLAEAASRFGSLGSALRSAGLFQIQGSLPWKVLLGIDALAVLAALETSAWRAWQLRRGDLRHVGLRFADAPPRQGTDVLAILDSAEDYLSSHGFRTRQVTLAKPQQVHAVARPWAAWLRPMLYCGVFLVLASLILVGSLRRVQQVSVGPGESEALTLRTGWSLLLDEFGENPSPAGSYTGHLALFGPEAEMLGKGGIGTQAPLLARGLSIHLQEVGPGLEVKATDASGQALPLQSATGTQQRSLFLQLDESEPEAYFAASDVGDTIRVVLHANADTKGRDFLVQVYHGSEAEPRAEDLLAGPGSLVADGVTYSFVPAPYAVLLVVEDPTHWVFWAGAVLALISALLIMAFPCRAVFIQAAESDGSVYVRFGSAGPDSEHIARRACDATEV
jgi:hypothetical protein